MEPAETTPETESPKPTRQVTTSWYVGLFDPDAGTYSMWDSVRHKSLADCERACRTAAAAEIGKRFSPIKVGRSFVGRVVERVEVER